MGDLVDWDGAAATPRVTLRVDVPGDHMSTPLQPDSMLTVYIYTTLQGGERTAI